jgi:hypothetical protein
MTPDAKDPTVHCPGDAGKATVQELLLIAQAASAGCDAPFIDHAECLYDDSGLPK